MKRAFLKNLVLSLLILLLGLSFVACDLFTNDDVDDTPEEKTYYQINLEQTENGTVSADKQKAEAGETVTLTVFPAEGYKLTAIYLDGEALDGTSFVMPEKDVTVSAAFEKIIVYYNVTVSSTENGSVSVDKQSAAAGETVTLTVSPAEGYKLTAIYLNGEALDGTSFVMPEKDVTVSAAFEKVIVYYNVTVSSTENGTISVDKQSATAGETVVLSATPDVAHKLDYFTVNGEAIEGNSFVMPEGDVTVSAHFAEIFAKGENFGYTNGFISTSGVDVSLDNGENPTTVINGGGEQYAYFNSVYSNKLYAEVKINAKALLNNEQYPKFGFALETDEGKRIAFFVESTTALSGNTVGRVYFDGNVYVWDTSVNTAVSEMEFSGDNYVTLAVVRDGADVYFYVNGRLVMCESGCELIGDLSSALSVFSFNTIICMKEYYVLTDDDADEKIQQAKVDYNRFNGENYGNSGEYTSSTGVDMTNDRGENDYISFDGYYTQHAYLKDVSVSQLYYQADFNIISIKNDDNYPKFGLFAQIADKTIYFYVDMKTDLTSTTVGAVYVRNGAWDWANARSVKVDGMAFSGEDKLTLAVMRDGADFVLLVNGKFALSVPDSELELNESAFGVFGFNTEMNIYNTQIDESEENLAEIKKLIPIVGPALNGVGYYIDQYVYDPDTNTITLLRYDTNARAIATLYQKGCPICTQRYVIEGTVKIYNTKTSGSAASKVEFQVGIDVNNFYKILIYRYNTDTSQNNSIYIEGANSQDNGNIANKRVKYNTLPEGDECILNYKVIFDYGTIYFVLEDEVQLIYETGWNAASYSFGVVQYADTVWTNTKATVGNGVDEIVANYKDDYMAYKAATSAGKDGYIESDTEVKLGEGGLLRSGGTLIPENLSTSSSNSVYIMNENGALVEYRLFNDNGKWGIERIVNGESEIIVAPVTKNCSFMNFEIAMAQSNAVFMLNGKVRDVIEGDFVNAYVAVKTIRGGSRLYNTYSVNFESNEAATAYIDSAPVYAYHSKYNGRINSLYDEYIASGDSEKGGVLIMGSSTMDFWDEWAEHMHLTDKVTGYNVGIGGTTTEDWLAAYDKLVKPFEPSCVIIFVGGNDLNVNGARPVDVADRLMKLMGMIHTDFPEADIHYIYSLPCPGYWENGHWARSDFAELTSTLKSYIDAVDYINDIDVSGILTDENGNPVREYFREDNIHQTAIGYKVWADYLNEVITFPENLGKWEVNSQVPVLESGFVTFGESVTLDFSDTEHAGNEGITVTVLDENGANVAVTREGDVFTFVMPTSNVTVSYFVSEKYTNEIWVDNGVILKGVFTSKSLDKESGLTVNEHFANQNLAECLPEVITSNTYVCGYAVSTDGGTTFGDIVTDANLVMLQEGDILKVCFAMMGSAVSGNSVFDKVELDALNNTVSLGYDGNTAATRYWGALYQDGELYLGNDYTVSMTVTIDKLADQNGVIEIQVSNMPAKDVYRGEKMYLRWEKNTTLLKYQETTNPAAGYNYAWNKTNTAITVADTTVTSITMNVVINVTSEGFTMTLTNAADATQTFTETYVYSDTAYKWENVSICFASIQCSKLTVSDITIEENS